MRRCFVCSKRLLAGAQNVQNVLDRCPSIGAPLVTVLREILEKPIPNEDLHSNDICKDCCKAAIKYDAAKKVLTHIKTDLLSKFKYGLQKFNLTYRTYPNKPVTFQKQVVVSSSKLQPLPADYVLNVAKIPGSLSPEKNNLPKNANVSSSQTVNIKSSTVASLTTQSKTTVSPQKTTATVKTTETIASTLSSILSSQSTTTTSNMLKFNVESLPKDFLSNAMVNKTAQKDKNDELHDEQPMEIDEDCTLVRVTQKDESENSSEENGQKSPKKSQYFDVSLLPLAEGSTNDTILGKLQILDQTEGEDVEDEAEEQETIVMTGDDGSIYRIVSGQKVVYADGEITLDDDDDGGSNQEDNDNDAHDSNDESQIELQVSGDEETANAIIAAAQEQGGAFIKVESGEMFRVKSVQSKTAGGQEDNQALHIVAVEDDVFKCLLCQNADKGDKSSKPFEVSDPARMTRHLKSEHDARVYICGICRRVMRRRQEYSKHIEEHTAKTRKFAADKKTYECPQCKKRFSTRTLLQLHINNHSGAKPYACSICHKAFASKYTHQAHLKTHLERSRPFQCQQCSKAFFTQQNLNQHEKTHLGIKDFVCNICGKAFGTQHNLEVHGVVHSGSKPFVCGVCGKAFARRAEVKDHMRIHTGERPFACEVCGATFTQRSNLHSHRRATHLDDKRHQCTQCPKRFKRRRLLDYHIKATHTGERPLVCGVCHATFVYPEHYKKHARIHSGDKPYVCEVCGKSFNSRDNRNTHRFVHSDKKPYECLVCGAGYMRKQLLYAHMNTSGHLAESIVVNQPRVQKVQEKIEPEPNTDSDHLEAIISQPNELQAIASKADEPVSSVEPAAKLFITGDKKIILQDGKINLLQDTMDPTLLSFIQNLDGSVKSDAGEHVQMVTSDENGAIRLVEVHIAANPWTINQG